MFTFLLDAKVDLAIKATYALPRQTTALSPTSVLIICLSYFKGMNFVGSNFCGLRPISGWGLFHQQKLKRWSHTRPHPHHVYGCDLGALPRNSPPQK